ncbi:FAD-dependent oxidoreductase [Microbulbifer sp. YPW1]|uniref:FAD-dependent oxidoreductase n=1 Tax=Microbulbifer sp. YPW1 TaxID=2745199 RepID=UPI00159B1EEF|nr:FAD-dependent oxidoreductase [Microbulbifer sp. YPW1]QKX17218.1 FAD-dependent oxidoreductase [Microbulbifer sp. YPW1]
MQKQTHSQDVVLIGGGHGHLELLRRWARQPVRGARLTLVSPQAQSGYSPMVPGMIAGHYAHADIHIDLPRLCRAAGARFVQACAHHIDPQAKRVSLLGQPDLSFDYLSLAVGASPCYRIPGSELAIPIKPIGQFYRYWEQLREQVYRKHQPLKLGIIGGGAGGCELAMALSSALEEPVYSGRVEIHLLQSGKKTPADYPLLARRLAAREMARLNVKHHPHWRVAEITARGVYSDEGQFLALDRALLCTESSAPPWLSQSGLAVDEAGFVQVDDYLRSCSHPHIFAVGDVASAPGDRPKSATESRNQGATLFENLCATLQTQRLQPYRPRRQWQRLLSCGGTHAIAAWGGIAAVGPALWRLKDYLDRRYINQFHQLPVPTSRVTESEFATASAPDQHGEKIPSAVD